MDAFELHRHVISGYANYTKSFVGIGDQRVRERIEEEMAQGLLWPESLLQLNPAFDSVRLIDELVIFVTDLKYNPNHIVGYFRRSSDLQSGQFLLFPTP